jgi:hypothetical protein
VPTRVGLGACNVRGSCCSGGSARLHLLLLLLLVEQGGQVQWVPPTWQLHLPATHGAPTAKANGARAAAWPWP